VQKIASRDIIRHLTEDVIRRDGTVCPRNVRLVIDGHSQMGVSAPIKTMAICNHEPIDSGIPRSTVPSVTNDTPLAMRIPLPKIQPANM